MVRGIRGAITVDENSAEQIDKATQEMLQAIIKENSLEVEDIISALFTVTLDLNAAFPAVTARKLGWKWVPLMCCTEIPVPGALPLCIRVLLHVNTQKSQDEVRHIYLRKAVQLRQDLEQN
ncbi:chorismate mutase [Desulfitobacterium metallireducens]|uniref:chorismate mutase n=1 Tax=Desulfitobacterium metallireducens DSM 15288 TaxID=871968 RepID=W0E964_9FIRM|nr:chorismate mutase [Desulfitobacterium metallireducens]AHF07292.1 chorismate mutase [Desulfitobacterium metallireducens DSM 15288]